MCGKCDNCSVIICFITANPVKALSFEIKPEDGRSEGRSTADKQRRLMSAC